MGFSPKALSLLSLEKIGGDLDLWVQGETKVDGKRGKEHVRTKIMSGHGSLNPPLTITSCLPGNCKMKCSLASA